MSITHHQAAVTAAVINQGLASNHTGCSNCRAPMEAMPKRNPDRRGWFVLIDIAHFDADCPTLAERRGRLLRATPWNLTTVLVRHRQYWGAQNTVGRAHAALSELCLLMDDQEDMPEVRVSPETVRRLWLDIDEIAAMADDELDRYVPGEEDEAPF